MNKDKMTPEERRMFNVLMNVYNNDLDKTCRVLSTMFGMSPEKWREIVDETTEDREREIP